jgi:RND family efflux transporter MFP subunit
MMKSITINRAGIGSAVLALACTIGQLGCKSAATEAHSLTPVRVAHVETISTGAATRYSANIIPNAQVDLAFKSGGYVESIRQVRGADGRTRSLDAGDWVSRGTVMAVVRQKDYAYQREQARAQLDRARADYDQATLNFERTEKLYSAQSATKPEYDSARAQQQSALAAINNAKAVLSVAETAFDDATLRAPFDGWVVKRSVDVGALVGPSVAGFTVADTRTVRVVFGVPDIAIARIKPGQRERIAVDAAPDRFEGHITSISPSADPKSRVYSVEVSVPNPKDQLKAGMIASLELGAEPLAHTALALPLSAVIRDPKNPEGFAVLIAEGTDDRATVQAQAVELGDEYGNMIRIVAGVKPGDRVVTTGATLVKSGEQVRIID